MRKCTCPNCNAALEFSEDREFGFCEFCGTKIILDDVRVLTKHEDVAEVKRIELEREKLHIEQEEKDKKRIRFEVNTEKRKKFLKIWVLLWVAVIVVLALIWVIALLFGASDAIKEAIVDVNWIGVLGLTLLGCWHCFEYADSN